VVAQLLEHRRALVGGQELQRLGSSTAEELVQRLHVPVGPLAAHVGAVAAEAGLDGLPGLRVVAQVAGEGEELEGEVQRHLESGSVPSGRDDRRGFFPFSPASPSCT
jgi:hypothetical protein